MNYICLYSVIKSCFNKSVKYCLDFVIYDNVTLIFEVLHIFSLIRKKNGFTTFFKLHKWKFWVYVTRRYVI